MNEKNIRRTYLFLFERGGGEHIIGTCPERVGFRNKI
jgi:hypothetical protein